MIDARLVGFYNLDPTSVQAKVLKIAVTGTASASIRLPEYGHNLRVVNEGTATVFIHVTQGSATATVPGTTYTGSVSTSTPILSGEDAMFTILPVTPGVGTDSQVWNISAITGGGGSTIYVSVGEGK